MIPPGRRTPPRPRGYLSKATNGPENGHIVGTADAGDRMNTRELRRALARQAAAPTVPVAPRLLDLEATAVYLGVSTWTVRDLEHGGFLPRVRIPMSPKAQQRPRAGRNGGGSGELRKLLFDRVDLDECVEKWKERATP